MSLRADQKALVFFGAVAVLGAGVRVVRAAGGPPAGASQPALDRQIRSSDSALQSVRSGRKKKSSARERRMNQSAAAADTGHRRRPAPPLDRRGYVGGRLDIDVASAAQIDSLPGVTPLMARRIVADRMARGPFMTADGMRRVIGVSPGFLKQLDNLITFSGTFIQSSPSDTIIPKRRRGRGNK